MLDRKTLNEEAKKLQEKHAFKDGERVLSANSEIFHANICEKYAIFNGFVDEGHSDEEVATAKAPVLSAIALYNDEQRMLRIEQMQDMTHKDAMRSYLDDQCVKGFALKQNKEKRWELKAVDSVELVAYDFVSAICSADLKGVLDACCIFVDNVAKMEFGEDAFVSRKSAHESYIDLRKRKGWTLPKDAKSVPKALAAQLTEICNMISCKTAPKMQTTDVKFIKFFVIDAKSKANEAGKFVIRNDATIVNAIFRAMYTRHNKLAYDWQNQSGFDKNPARTSGANKAMAESDKSGEFSGRVEADGEQATVTLGESEN
mgnify:CR=1 FL=1